MTSVARYPIDCRCKLVEPLLKLRGAAQSHRGLQRGIQFDDWLPDVDDRLPRVDNRLPRTDKRLSHFGVLRMARAKADPDGGADRRAKQ
jgi:hypothetical protein